MWMRHFGLLTLLSPLIYPSFKDPLNDIAKEIAHVVLKIAKLKWFKIKKKSQNLSVAKYADLKVVK